MTNVSVKKPPCAREGNGTPAESRQSAHPGAIQTRATLSVLNSTARRTTDKTPERQHVDLPIGGVRHRARRVSAVAIVVGEGVSESTTAHECVRDLG
jgi:hypothetical protein